MTTFTERQTGSKKIGFLTHYITKIGERTYELGYVEKDSCGNTLGWYWNIEDDKPGFEGGIHDTSRRHGRYFATREEAFNDAKAQ